MRLTCLKTYEGFKYMHRLATMEHMEQKLNQILAVISIIKSLLLTSFFLFFDMTGIVTDNGETIFCLFPQGRSQYAL